MQLTQSIKEIMRKPFWGLLSLLVFLTPLIMSNNSNELFEFPKTFFVYFTGTGMFSLWLTSLVLKRSKIVWPSILVIVFLLSNIISTAFSLHLYTSFWGYYTRFNDGLISIFVFTAIYFVCKNCLGFTEYFGLMKAGALSVLPVGLIGIMQHFGWETGLVERVYSTLGQPNWLAQYLVIILPFILYLFVAEFSFFWGLTFLIGFSCLWFTYSMSGIIGFVFVTLVFLGIGIYKKIFSKAVLIRFVSIYLICFLIAISNLGLFKDKLMDTFKDLNRAGVSLEKKEVVENNEVVENKNIPDRPEMKIDEGKIDYQDNDYKVSDPGFIRLGLWRGSLNLFLSSPKVFLIGTGPETFPYAFQPFRLASLNYTSEWDFVFNKPHNYYLEILTETGLLGFLIYILLLFKLLKKLPFYILPGLVGFIVTNLFGWPVISTALLFWLWLSWSESK
jgi:hypothetical protein